MRSREDIITARIRADIEKFMRCFPDGVSLSVCYNGAAWQRMAGTVTPNNSARRSVSDQSAPATQHCDSVKTNCVSFEEVKEEERRGREKDDLEICPIKMVKLGEEDTDWSYTALPTLSRPPFHYSGF